MKANWDVENTCWRHFKSCLSDGLSNHKWSTAGKLWLGWFKVFRIMTGLASIFSVILFTVFVFSLFTRILYVAEIFPYRVPLRCAILSHYKQNIFFQGAILNKNIRTTETNHCKYNDTKSFSNSTEGVSKWSLLGLAKLSMFAYC